VITLIRVAIVRGVTFFDISHIYRTFVNGILVKEAFALVSE